MSTNKGIEMQCVQEPDVGQHIPKHGHIQEELVLTLSVRRSDCREPKPRASNSDRQLPVMCSRNKYTKYLTSNIFWVDLSSPCQRLVYLVAYFQVI